MRINSVDLDPAANPAVLNTCTWDERAAIRQCEAMEGFFEQCADTVGTASCEECFKTALPCAAVASFCAVPKRGFGCCMVKLPDGQRVFALVGEPDAAPESVLAVLAQGRVSVLPVDTDTVKWFVTHAAPRFAPRAFGAVPRLGIGGRQTVMVWPGIIEAMRVIGGPAETIQNSAYRELAPMDVILAPPGDEVTYLPGHGSLNVGHTGSSIEGFWLAGVVSHIENSASEPFGADLDHVPVKSADENGMAMARRLIDCGRHFSFFTLDTSFLFDFASPDLPGRYDAAIDAAVEMYRYIEQVKNGEAFDFEFSLDEGPEVTEPDELRYVLDRLGRNGVDVTFIAPNVGFEKRVDYRRPDGLPGLEARVREMAAIAAGRGAMLDFHSGSDKSPDTYRTISRAADGRLKLKVSGKLQLILAEVLADLEPAFFDEWWDYTLFSAKAEAQAGSKVAAEYVRLVEERRQAEGASFKRSPADRFFTDFSFGMVGARDHAGNFIHRHRFYALSPAVQGEYTKRVTDYVVRLAEDLGLRS